MVQHMTPSGQKLVIGGAFLLLFGLVVLLTRSVSFWRDVKATWVKVPGKLRYSERKHWTRPLAIGRKMEIIDVEYQYEYPIGTPKHVGSRFSSFDFWSIAYMDSPELIAVADAVTAKARDDGLIDVYVDADNPRRSRLTTLLPPSDLLLYFFEPWVAIALGVLFTGPLWALYVF
jgi:hypothetical protein